MSRIHPVAVSTAAAVPSTTSAAGLRQRHQNAHPTEPAAIAAAAAAAAPKVRSTRIRAIDFRPPRPIPAHIFVKGAASSSAPARDLRASAHRQTPAARGVSIFWREKVQVVLDALQIMGVLWASGGAWPDSFRALAQFLPALSGDILSVIEYNAGEGNGFPRDWQAMARSFATLALTGWCLLPMLVTCVRRCCCCRCCVTSPHDAVTKTLRVEECIYLPVFLSLLHLATCRGAVPLDTWTFPADAFSCWCWWDQQHGSDLSVGSWLWSGWALLVVTVIACLVAVEFLLRVPWVLRGHANEVHIHSGAERHERYLCAKELEYMLYINTDYEDEHFQTVASFRRHAIHHRERALGLKVVSALIAVLLPAVSLGGWTMSCHAGVLLFWAIVQSLAAPYRCRST
jgi:hypothetical protein